MASFGAPLLPQAAGRKPNIVVILADDMGYGDIGCYGSPDVPTPHIDALAASGTRFTDGYVSCAVCSPSRVALLTGRYQQRLGHEFNSGPPEREAQINFGLPPQARILPQFLKPAGYRSAAIGKWHLGIRAGYHPLDRGFDHFFGFLTGGNDYVTENTRAAHVAAADGYGAEIPRKHHDPIYRGRDTVPESRYLTDAFTAEAVSFIEQNRSNPFFLYLAYNAIHTPLQSIDKYLDRFPAVRNEKHRMLAAMTSALDDGVGEILGALRRQGLDRDTMVVFLSDNGCPEMTGAGTNGPLNGEKVTYYEGGIRVPFMVRWTGKFPAGRTYRQPVVSRDIVPTFLAAAGITPSPAIDFDGTGLAPFLTGRRSGAPHEALFWRAGKARAVRKGRWKLIEFGDTPPRLFDLETDLGETRNIAAAHQETVRELREAWQSWSQEMGKPAWPPRYREVTVNGETLNWEL